ncbi:unnamed protein product [Rodentolepis nana]|uniref:Rab-GAP TBC domain-containing protein n=1 Tax=Rodentolepis nana TaxID=102285 RepID=A0A0R3T3X5_RODNA|nr:unnamed protein product [Rodentolepis nana]
MVNAWSGLDQSQIFSEGVDKFFRKKFLSYSGLRQELCSRNISVFSFAWVKNSVDYTGLSIKWPISSWPSSLFLRKSKSSSLPKEISLFDILTNYPKKKLQSCSTFFLVLKIHPTDSRSATAYIIHFDPLSSSLRCLQQFKFGKVVCVSYVQQFLEGIVNCFSQNSGKTDGYTGVLTAALFTQDASTLANHVYLCLTLKFLYRYLGKLSSIFSRMKVELSPSHYHIWGTFLPILAESSRPDYESALDDIEYFFKHMDYFSLVNKEVFPETIMQWIFDNAWRTNFASLPMASRIFERFFLPYITDMNDSPEIIFPWFLLGVLRSTSFCKAFAEFHPKMFKSIMEDIYVLSSTMDSFENDLSSLEKWMKESFRLYCHSRHQLGQSKIVLPLQIYHTWERNHVVDNIVSQFDRSIIVPRIPRLSSLAIIAARFHIRQIANSKPLPRPSFSSQLNSFTDLPPYIKSLIQFTIC